jgi:hypothetical protein
MADVSLYVLDWSDDEEALPPLAFAWDEPSPGDRRPTMGRPSPRVAARAVDGAKGASRRLSVRPAVLTRGGAVGRGSDRGRRARDEGESAREGPTRAMRGARPPPEMGGVSTRGGALDEAR